MRKRKYLIGVPLALVACFAMSGVAHGATATQLKVVADPSTNLSADGKTAISLDVTVDTQFTPGAGAVAQTPSQSVLSFDPNMKLGNTGKLAQCNPTSLAGTTTAGAQAVCGPSQVGTGSANLCSSLGGCGAAQVGAVVTAFNGVPQGGLPTILLHTRVNPPANTTTVLTGVLAGNTLTVTVPDTAATGLQLTQFKTFIPIKQTDPVASGASSSKKKKKKKKKKATTPTFYITAKCVGSSGTWNHSITTTYRGGAATLFATATQPCTGAKPKKKKKKKKKK